MSTVGSAAREARQALRQVLERTQPPSAVADPEELIQRMEEMVSTRTEYLEALGALLVKHPDVAASDRECRDLYRQLCEREASWRAAGEQARHILGQRLRACRRLQQARRS